MIRALFKTSLLATTVWCTCSCLPLRAQLSNASLLWPNPAPVSYLTPLGDAQLNAVAVGGKAVPVPLTSVFNRVGITSFGTPIPAGGGFDDVGRTYAAELVGSSLTWRGVLFELGAPDVPDAVAQADVPLPQGNFGTLLLLGALVNDVTPATGTLTVVYTDGTTSSVTQSFSDWVVPLNFPGEILAACYPYRYWIYGPVERDSVCIYGYSVALDPARIVKSVQLPDTPHIVMLAAALVPPALEGLVTYTPAAGTVLPPGTSTLDASFVPAGTASGSPIQASVPITVMPPPAPILPALVWPQPQPIAWGTPLSALQLDADARAAFSPTAVPLAGHARAKAIDQDGIPFDASGVDGKGNAWSSTQLGPAVDWEGVHYPLVDAAIPDAATDTTIELPSGNFAELSLLGVAGSQAEPAQEFTVAYTDGTTTAASLSLSAWDAPQHFDGESTVSTTSYADTSSGGRLAGRFNLYGYRIPLDSAKLVRSLRLPPNLDVMVLAAALAPPDTFAVPGAIAYTPPAGTLLPEGSNALSAAFTPVDNTLFTPVTGMNSIVVTQPQLLVEANDADRLYGVANPVFTGSVTGTVLGNSFTETFATGATPLSQAGTYPIVPTASGPELSQYLVTLVDGTLTIAKAPAVASVQASSPTAAQGAPVTLTVNVASTTQGNPTGSVQFFANGILLGTASLAHGKGSLSTSDLSPGVSTISVSYNGDANFLSASASTSLLIQAFDFNFDAPAGTVLKATWGTGSMLNLHIAPQGVVYQSNVTFAAVGIDGVLSSANFAPQIVSSAAGPAQVLFTVSLDRLAESKPPSKSPGRYLPLAALLAFPLAATRRPRHRLAAVLLAVALVASLSGCGSGYRYAEIPLSVTATDGFHTHTLALTLEVSGPR